MLFRPAPQCARHSACVCATDIRYASCRSVGLGSAAWAGQASGSSQPGQFAVCRPVKRLSGWGIVPRFICIYLPVLAHSLVSPVVLQSTNMYVLLCQCVWCTPLLQLPAGRALFPQRPNGSPFVFRFAFETHSARSFVSLLAEGCQP
jgi:hypothetical protein